MESLVKYTLLSDLHLDFPQGSIPYDQFEENIIIAGDTTNGLGCLKFFDKLKRKGFNVFAIDGNHEHYSNVGKNRTIESTISRFREDYPNIYKFGEVPVIGVNGWYSVSNGNSWFNYMNDGRHCIGGYPDFAAVQMRKHAYDDYLFLHRYLSNSTEKCIVVTHTAPSIDTLDPKFEGYPSNEYYYNPNMMKIIENHKDKIHVWNHGHTHAFADKNVNGVRVICNPRGYPGENPNWQPITVEI